MYHVDVAFILHLVRVFLSKDSIYFFFIIVAITTPIAIIVCEGDIETISHISKALRKHIPVIIMKGSGKAADVVVEYLEKY